MKLHGINIPIFALRNPLGSGVGEYLDLIPMIEWTKKIGFQIIQLLPINDSGLDPSPYSALSANALHPLFLSLSALPDLTDEMKSWLQKLAQCNSKQRFDYHKVHAAKLEFLRAYYELHGKTVLSSPSFHAFEKSMPWLEKFAHFKSLKMEGNEEEIGFHKMVQYFCF